MTEVVGIKFREVGKIYYFDPDSMKIEKGVKVIVETARGMECGDVVVSNKMVNDEEIVPPLKKVIRVATPDDLKKLEENKLKEQKAFDICKKKIVEHKLDMDLVNVEYTFDASKITFYFTSDGRVDFREMVKDLASVFRTRIELRQIGVRDEAKMIGGLGMCGREICCSSYLDGFRPVSIKMAKEQGLSLNPAKISGTCGRLMCCLKNEQDVYEHLLKVTPKVGAVVKTSDGKGIVIEANMLKGTLKVRLDKNPDAAPKSFSRKDVKIIKDAQIKLSREEIDAMKDIEN
ncbi:MAG: stage 0 sporulation family protein [Clostridia bacterium]|nr:stage 0 sporulation family protein [Clostridia bacterium]